MISLHLSRELHLEPEVRADLPKPRSILSIHPPLSAGTLGALDIIVIVLSLFFFFFLLFFFSSFFVLRRAASTLAARGRQLAMDTVSSTPRKPNTWLLLWCSVTLALFCLAYMSGIDEILPNHNISPLWALTSRPYLAARPSIAGEMSRPEVSSAIEPAWTRTNESQECELPWTTLALDEASLLSCAARLGRQRQRQDGLVPKPRVAFLFITRDRLPHEALWRRFFRGHEDRYSVYVHSRPDYESPSESLFHNHHVPSEGVRRLSMSLVRAMRRLLAYAIVDPDHGPSNSWFVYACEATVPIRSFDFVYEYLTNSQQSFVESFLPHRKYLTWDTEPEFRNSSLRKGELWMAVHARHAVMILNDTTIFNKFNTSCKAWCGPDEQYIQTLLGLLDPQGISNWTTMYVNWTQPHWTSPNLLGADVMTPDWFKDIQGRTVQTDGMFHDTSAVAEEQHWRNVSRDCVYNGVSNSPCYLFARKVEASASADHLQSLPSSVLGY